MHALRIAASMLGASLRAQMQYRVNFVVELLIQGLLWQGTGLLFIWVLLDRFHAIGGWTAAEIAFLFALRLLVRGLAGAFFYGDMGQVYGGMMITGEYDRYLVRPVPALVQIWAGHAWIGSVGEVIFGALLVAVAGGLAHVCWTPAALVYVVLAVCGGALIEAASTVFVGALAFRFLNTYQIASIFLYSFVYFGGYPTRIYGGVAQFVFTFVVPIAFMAYIPAGVLFGRTDELGVPLWLAQLAPLVGVLCFALAIAFWRSQERHYQSAGH